MHNEQPIKPDKPDFYYTDFITEHAVQLIDGYSADPKPFFLYVAYTAPHWPLQAARSGHRALRANLQRRLGRHPAGAL